GISSYIGGGGRVAIRYNTVSSLATLKSKISAVGYSVAGEGTVYLKDLTTSYQILIIKGDGGDKGTSTAINLSDIDEVILDGGGLSLIGSYPWNLTSSFSLNNGAFLTSNSTSPIIVSGTLSILSGSTLTTNGTFSADDLLVYNGTYNSYNSSIIYNDLSLSGGTFNNNSSLSIHNDLNLLSGALNNYSSLSVYNNSIIKSYSIVDNNSSFNVSGNLTIENGGIITHDATSTTSSNLIVGGTLTINSGGKYDVSGKGIATTGAGSQTIGASYGGYGINSSKLPYGDIYNPTNVGSYGYNSSYPGGGLVKMIVGNLVNNGSILANGSNISWGQGSGGSINITVNGNISGNGIYQAKGGGTTSYNGGGGRIAIRYNTVSDLTILKSKISINGPSTAGEGTIYLKDISTGKDYLLVKGDSVSGNYNTSVGTGYTDYYFDTIEVTDYGKLYKVGTQNIVSPLCIVSGFGVIDPLINCTGDTNFRYYDLGIGIKNFSPITRKYEFLINGPSGGYSFMTASNGTITGNGNILSRIKIVKIGTYIITFNLYDGNLANSQILRTVTKTVTVQNN
ncbi:MAG: hypothetical protein PHN31_03495, partial [Candidatus Gracilibacteria bacterium]|nr:hypothetical protein [Candidatus Gracilibacteria bacterium]